jgi:hypothetical protein
MQNEKKTYVKHNYLKKNITSYCYMFRFALNHIRHSYKTFETQHFLKPFTRCCLEELLCFKGYVHVPDDDDDDDSVRIETF